MNVQWASIAITSCLALIGLLGTYLYNLRLARRKDRLDLVTRQINEFYGPFYISTQAGKLGVAAFRKKLGQKAVFADRTKPTPMELEEWKIWLPTVLMPINEHREKLILSSAHLIRESEMPSCLLLFVAHVAAYRSVLRKWEQGDYSEFLSVIDFPAEIEAYASTSFIELKHEQARLLGNA